MVYIPKYENNNCAVVQNNRIIRVYDTIPQNNSTIEYTDYYLDLDYISYRGSQTFNNYTTIPTCRTDVTTDYFYSLNFDKALFIFLVLSFICIIVPFKFIQKLMGGWLHI